MTARWLPGVIDSLLVQTHQDWELVIGDNLSTDGIEDVMARYADPRIRYHRWPEHIDYAGNANRTLGLCQFEWLQYLSADNRLHANVPRTDGGAGRGGQCRGKSASYRWC